MNRHMGAIGSAAMAGAALLVAVTPAIADRETPFKQTNIHFETNSSACDMGIQMSFDTDGITRGKVENPLGRTVFRLGAIGGREVTGDVTEMFQERVEPPIIDLEDALGCEPSEDAITLAELLEAWPAGTYEFEGESGGEEL